MLGYGALYMASARSAGRELVHEHCDYVCTATLLTNTIDKWCGDIRHHTPRCVSADE